jgi:hypothetical protein
VGCGDGGFCRLMKLAGILMLEPPGLSKQPAVPGNCLPFLIGGCFCSHCTTRGNSHTEHSEHDSANREVGTVRYACQPGVPTYAVRQRWGHPRSTAFCWLLLFGLWSLSTKVVRLQIASSRQLFLHTAPILFILLLPAPNSSSHQSSPCPSWLTDFPRWRISTRAVRRS